MTSSGRARAQDLTRPYASLFDAWIRERTGREPLPVTSLRKEAFAHFSEWGFPTQRLEDWKYTNVLPLVQEPFAQALHSPAPVDRDFVDQITLEESRGARLVFVNGVYAESLSILSDIPKGVRITSLARALRENPDVIGTHLARHVPFSQDGFAALNTAFYPDGAFIHLAAGASFEAPIQMIFISLPQNHKTISYPRNLIIAERNSRAVVAETYLSPSGKSYWTNAVTELYLAENSRIDHYKIQEEDGRAFHVAAARVTQERDSRYRSFAFEAGGTLARSQLGIELRDAGSECRLLGLGLGSGKQHLDSQTLIRHVSPNTKSEQLYKGILDGSATSVFNGKIIVEKDAQKTNARQAVRDLLLSGGATADARPQLEIFADDVKCAHGAAIGQLDETTLFYLKSRGIGHREAQSLLTTGFAAEVTDKIEVASLQARISRIPRIKFSTVLPGGE